KAHRTTADHVAMTCPRSSRVNLCCIAAVSLLVATVLVGSTRPPRALAGTPVPGAGSCPVFPVDNIWNTDISSAPVHPRSAAWMGSMNSASTRLHPDFGRSGDPNQPYGIPISVVGAGHATRTFTFDYPEESDPGPYPFGSDIAIEGGSDRHAIIVDASSCKLYELYAVNGSRAGSGAIWDLRSNALRTDGYTSADAAGLPILPGLLRYDEVLSGQVSHAIRFTASRTDRSYLWPARHQAGSASNSALPPMGARFRLRADLDLSRYRPDTQVVLRAMQNYGMVLADNGSNWYFTGAASNDWPDELLDELKSIPADLFEAIDVSGLQVAADSGQASTGIIEPPAAPTGPGYLLVGSDGRTYPFGGLHSGTQVLRSGTVDIELTPDRRGYWTVTSTGRVTGIGAPTFGTDPTLRNGETVTSMSTTASGAGYWLFTSQGRVLVYGDAPHLGDMSATVLNGPVLDSVPTPSGRGYYMVASDGGVFTFGDARFSGSMGGQRLNQPVRSLVPDPDGSGYWLVAGDGGIFAFGAPFRGSTGSLVLNAPVVGMVASGSGYLMVGADGGVFNFGNPFYGSLGGSTLSAPIVSVAASS
ncbi:MAG: hypothetical protein AB7Q27_07585, partial [Acidimicrobiia bacterium]